MKGELSEKVVVVKINAECWCLFQVWIEWKHDNHLLDKSVFFWKTSSWKSWSKYLWFFYYDFQQQMACTWALSFVGDPLNLPEKAFGRGGKSSHKDRRGNHEAQLVTKLFHVFFSDGIRAFWKRPLCVQNTQISDVRIYDQFYTQAQTTSRKIHDEQRAGKFHHSAGGWRCQNTGLNFNQD